MPKIYHHAKERSQIISFSRLNTNSLAYVTKYSGAKIIDINDHTTTLKLVHSELGRETTAICFSQDAKLIAFANNSIIYIVDLATKSLIKNITIPNEKIEILTFCPASTYLIAGTDCGRVYQYRYNNASLLSRICSFPLKTKRTKTNFVSALSIHNEKLACSGLGGALFVIDLHSKIRKHILIEQGSRINALCFIDEKTLVSANVDGDVLVHSLAHNKESKRIDAPFKNIRDIVKTPNSDYVIISAETNYLALLDIKKAKVADAKYIEFEKTISKIALLHDESLFVALEDSQILNAKLPNRAQLKELVMQNALYEAYRLVERAPILHNTIEYKLLQKRYKDIYKEALHALMNQNKAYALKCIAPLKGIKSKENEINSLFRAFENFNRFKIHYFEKKYALCFAMCSKYEPLMQTPLYEKIEEAWRDSFKNAYRHISLGDSQNAKALLHEYLTVASKREIIKLLLTQESDFMTFLHAVDANDFQTVDELIYKNKLFLETPTYISLNQSIEKNIKKIDLFIKQGELQKAKNHLKLFKNTTFMRDELERLITNFNAMIKLQNAYKANNFKGCYEILDANVGLNATELGISLNKRWAALVNECEEYALSGDAKSIKITLNNLISISTRTDKIGDLLRVSFQSKIKTFLADENYQGAQNIIYSYIDIFGNDNEMRLLMKNYENLCGKKLAITLDDGVRTPRDEWIKSNIIMEYSKKL
ncbi:MAG: WD40 repeat domain-containing protein [Sulfurimonas sp.]|nr:WD40 repeat domain-containing protein [Sulfurimonas sp.]MBU3938524.1 WD40 repeat domain-containing protein [bacterium]MBU4059007.1 WD40 repeat domain-containing protein [bacterium]MBU4109418.1 WD40 repeat domain-containing protein [bacterium]